MTWLDRSNDLAAFTSPSRDTDNCLSKTIADGNQKIILSWILGILKLLSPTSKHHKHTR